MKIRRYHNKMDVTLENQARFQHRVREKVREMLKTFENLRDNGANPRISLGTAPLGTVEVNADRTTLIQPSIRISTYTRAEPTLFQTLWRITVTHSHRATRHRSHLRASLPTHSRRISHRITTGRKLYQIHRPSLRRPSRATTAQEQGMHPVMMHNGLTISATRHHSGSLKGPRRRCIAPSASMTYDPCSRESSSESLLYQLVAGGGDGQSIGMETAWL